MPLTRPLAAVLRLVRTARGLSQEQFSGAVEARHIHNIEHAKTSLTLDTLETLSGRLDIDPVALLAYAARIEKSMSAAQYLEYLESELIKLSAMGIEAEINEHYRDDDVVTHRPGRRTNPVKMNAVLAGKAAGKTKREVSDELGIPWSTVNDIWKKS
jgi:transcriptional regulator with XRE-family HTH domain